MNFRHDGSAVGGGCLQDSLDWKILTFCVLFFLLIQCVLLSFSFFFFSNILFVVQVDKGLGFSKLGVLRASTTDHGPVSNVARRKE